MNAEENQKRVGGRSDCEADETRQATDRCSQARYLVQDTTDKIADKISGTL